MVLLTESEKRDIIRFLEAGKPLPDKYRFLLFDEKRQVELVWNGKNNEVLPGTPKTAVKGGTSSAMTR